MSKQQQLNRLRGNTLMFRSCLYSSEPIILCDGNKPRLIIMDSRIFAKAYGVHTLHFDMQPLFEHLGMDVAVTATQIKNVVGLLSVCECTSKPVIVRKYGWALIVAMNAAEYDKHKHLF